MEPNLFDPQPPQQPANSDVKIEESWKKVLAGEFEKPYFKDIRAFIKKEKAAGQTIYPPGKLIFNAFNQTPFDQLKVVILGQDPYHGPGQAHGLCFSVQDGVKPPPSLVNIYKEIEGDLGYDIPHSKGNLLPWAQQGVFLLNAILTVRKKEPASHREIGWETFTNAVIRTISSEKKGVVFMLWGKFAKNKSVLIDQDKHLILTAPHPSPYSANSGFFGCKHFSRANEYLKSQGEEPIDWQL